MAIEPTNAEVAFWVVGAIIAIIIMVCLVRKANKDLYIDWIREEGER